MDEIESSSRFKMNFTSIAFGFGRRLVPLQGYLKSQRAVYVIPTSKAGAVPALVTLRSSDHELRLEPSFSNNL
jgi:hypothetical protein